MPLQLARNITKVFRSADVDEVLMDITVGMRENSLKILTLV